MPGVYTSFIKAGRVTVPVELHFIPSKVFDDITGKENLSSKWAALKHWREIKDMLKPAVEAAIKYNNDLTGTWEKYTGQPNFASRNSTAIGYVYEANKGKFTDIMDPKDTWTDDDDEEDDENSGMRDYGGRFNKFPPTKVYLRACALMRTPSCSKKDDEKKITKELGVKPDAYHSFFQPHNQNHDTTPSCSSSNKKRKSSVYASSDLRKNATSTNTLNGASMNQTSGYRELEPMSSTSSMEYVDNDQFNPMGFGRSPASSTSLDDFTQRNGMSNEAQIDNDDDLWALRGTFYEEKDDEDNEDSMGLYGYSANLHSTNNSMLDDEDEESLPDIDCTPVSLPPVINSPTKGTNTGLSKPSKKTKKRDSGGLGSGKSKNSKRQKLSDELVENAQPINNKKKSEELPNGRLSFDKEFLNGTSIPNSLSTKKHTKKGTGVPSLGKKDKNNFFDSLTNTDGTASKKNRRRKGKNEGKRKSPDIFGNIPGSISKKTRANTAGKRKEASILVTRKERRNSDVHNNANRSVLIEKVSTLNTPLTGRVLSVKEADKLSRSPQKEKEKDASTQSRIPELPEVLINAEDLRKEIGADKYGAVFNNSLDYNNPKFITITTSAPTLSSSLSSTKTSETLAKSHKTPVPTAGCSSSQKKSNNNTTPKVQRSLRPKRKSKLSFSSDTKEKESQSQTPATSSLKSIEKSSSYSPSSVITNASSLSTTETRKFTERPVSALDACLKSLALKTAAERKDYADNEGIGSSFGLSPSSIFNSKLHEPGSGNPRSVIDVMNSTRKLSKNNTSIDSDAESVVLLKQTEKRRRRRDRQKKLVVKQERQDSPVHSNNFLNNASFKSSAPNSPFEIDPEMPVLVMQVTPEEFLRRSSPTPVLSSNVPAPVLQLEGSINGIKHNSHNSPSPSEANNRIQTRKTKLSQTIVEPKLIPVNSSQVFTVPLTTTASGATLEAIPTPKHVQPQASQPLSPTKAQPVPAPSKLPTIRKPKPVKSTGGNKKPESYKNPTKKPKSFRSSSVSRAKRYSRRLTDKTKNDISTTRDNLSGLPTAIKDTEASLLNSQPEVLPKDKLLPASLSLASNAAFQPITAAEQNKSIALSPSTSVSYLQLSEPNNSNNHIRDRDSSERDLSQSSSAELRKSQSTGLAAIQEAYASDSDDELNSVVNSSNKQVNINVGSEYYTLDLNRDGEFQLQELGANVIDEFISPADDSDMATFNSISIPYEENSDNEDLFSFDMENSGGNTIQIVINNDGSANTNVIVPGDCSNNNALTAEEIPTFVLVGSRAGSPESSPAFSPVGSPMVSPVGSPVVSPPGSPVGYSEDRSLVLYHHDPPPSLSFDNVHRSISPAPEQELNMPPPMFRPPRTPQKNKANAKLPVAAVSQRLAIPRRSAPASPGQKRALAAVGVEVHPSRLSTLEIATNPHFFNAGIELCNQLVSNQTDVKEIRRKIFHETKSSSSIRSSSPDITLLCSVKKARKQREELEASNSQQRKSKLKIKQEDEKSRKGSEEEDRLNVSSDVHEGGVALIKELVSRTETISSQSRSYEPKGDEYDLSQRSLCMLNLFPEYDKKSRKYKQNTKNVQELSDDRIKNYFNLILPTLKDVSNGTLESTRRHLCREVPVSRAKLSQLNAISPFTNAQGNLLATLIEEKFQCCPDGIDSANYTDYLSYVMLPETAIRIYAVVNKMTYDEAEQEMIHGATCVNSY